MKKKTLTLLIAVFALSLFLCSMAFCGQPGPKDHPAKWVGPYPPIVGKVYYRYCETWLGEDTWTERWDCFQFDNRYDHPVTIKYQTETQDSNGNIIQRNEYTITINAKTPGDLINLAPGETLAQITVIF